METWAQFRMDASKHVSRRAGQSAVAAAAYRAGERLMDLKSEQIHDYRRRYGVVEVGLVLPEGAPAWSREELWNTAEAAEKRKDARVARKIEMALPADASDAQRLELARAWAVEISARYGVAVDYAVHRPDCEGSDRNHHVHYMMTTRKLTPDGFTEKANLELSNTDQKKRGLAVGDDAIFALRVALAERFNAFARQHGLEQTVDPRSYAEQGIKIDPTVHVGVHATAMDRQNKPAERAEQHLDRRTENLRKLIERPEIILDLLSQHEAVFTRRDIARELHRYVDDAQTFQQLLARVEASPELVKLVPETRSRATLFSTKEMIATEAAMMETAKVLAAATTHRVNVVHVDAAIERYSYLSEEQREAVRHVTTASRLASVAGTAGAGKSASLRAAREAWEAEGYRVVGAALAGKAGEELQNSAGISSRTLHAYEHSWKKGRDLLGSSDVLVIDEAGMVGSRQLARVLAVAQKAGAKVVLVGDAAQLQPIEAGAPFRAVVEEIGVVHIETVRRQRHEWARAASQDLARGQIASGLAAYSERGHVRLLDSREESKQAIARDYVADNRDGSSALILAHTNADVEDINKLVRSERQRLGQIDQGERYKTERGERQFAAGDRVVFLRNERAMGVKNGTLGTVQGAADGRLTVQLDNGNHVVIDQATYADIDHGYAITIHKSQGATVDRSYLLASGGMDRNLTYVGMTRHRDTATLYGGRDDFDSEPAMVGRLGRARVKESTLDYAERRGLETQRPWLENARALIERGRERLMTSWNKAVKVMESVMERAARAVPETPEGRSRADELREAFAKKPAENEQDRAASLREAFKPGPGREAKDPAHSRETLREMFQKQRENEPDIRAKNGPEKLEPRRDRGPEIGQ